MTKQVILTGIRANNDLHLGNYFGALLPIVDIAKTKAGEYQVNLFVPDLHSFTTPIDHSTFKSNIAHSLKIFVAAGLPIDNQDVYIYRQSYIPAHSELTWILDCFTGMGEMSRMTQYKDKSSKLSEDRISVGLFNYPVLMAVDMLLYSAKYVPVGDDQTQHIEYTRDIGMRMNAQFGDLFVVPEPVNKQHEFFNKDQGLRIKDLADPSKKMSKSDDSGKGVIFLSESPESAKQKIMSATTDSLNKIAYNKDTQSGIANLMEIMSLLSGRSLDDIITEFDGQTQYGPFKQAVAEQAADFLTDFQSRLSQVNETDVNAKLSSSEEAMSKVANETLLKVQAAVGLR